MMLRNRRSEGDGRGIERGRQNIVGACRQQISWILPLFTLQREKKAASLFVRTPQFLAQGQALASNNFCRDKYEVMPLPAAGSNQLRHGANHGYAVPLLNQDGLDQTPSLVRGFENDRLHAHCLLRFFAPGSRIHGVRPHRGIIVSPRLSRTKGRKQQRDTTTTKRPMLSPRQPRALLFSAHLSSLAQAAILQHQTGLAK